MKTIEVMYYYVKLSKEEGYKHRFLPEYFQAFLMIRDILYKRAIELNE